MASSMHYSHINLPLVSVGLPVFNGAATVKESILSVLDQTWACFELIISDNASTDQTEEICRELAKLDPRIRYIRHESNVGALANFSHVLACAKGSFFMWLGADDVISPSFLGDNVQILMRTPIAVSSLTYLRQNLHNARDEYISLDCDSPTKRIKRYLRNPGTNARFYSLHRTAAVRKCMPLPNIVANDWLLVVRMLTLGSMVCCPAKSFYNKTEKGASSSYRSLMKIYGKSGLSSIFPLLQFTIAIHRELPFGAMTIGYAIKHLLIISAPGQNTLVRKLIRNLGILRLPARNFYA
jgi:hypothetical protein